MKITDITAEKKEKQIQRLAAYCRVSSDSEDQLHSFAAQVCYYSNYEKQHPEFELVGVYADEGLSGTSMKNRTELQRMIKDCEKGKIDRIITKSVSRFARNTHDLLKTIRLMKELGVTVFFEEQGIDTAQLNSELFLTFPGMIAQQESESISGNMRWSYKKRMESGEFNCCAPAYGFDLVDGELVVNEKEAAVVRRIFNMYLQGMGKQRIADILNDGSIPKKNGEEKWSYTTVSYVLSNERYIGDALLQKKYTTDTFPYKKRPNKGEKPQYYVENANPAIVSKETFDAVRELSHKRMFKLSNRSTHTLSKILVCSECGRVFRKQTSRNKLYWITTVTEQSECPCKKHRISETGIFEAFSLMTYKLKENRNTLIDSLISQLEELKALFDENMDRVSEIDKQIAQLCAQKHVLTKLQNSGILSHTDYAKQASEIENSLSELRSERKKELAENKDSGVLDEIKTLRALIDVIVPIPGFDSELFEQIVKKIYVIDNTTIRFKLIGDIELTERIDEKARCKQSWKKEQHHSDINMKTA